MSYHMQTQAPWHCLALSDLKLKLETTERGLSKEESAKRLVEYGPNQLPQKPPVPLLTIVLRQFQSPLIYVLALAAVVSLATGDMKDAAFIGAVLVLNALIGAYQEFKAEQSSSALRKLLQIRASVCRNGEVEEVGAEEIVPGDLVVIESGNRVPADIRLLSTHSLEIDESLLSGESLPVLKDPAWSGAEATQVSDRMNMVFAGSVVSRGRGKGLVVATGTATSVGQLALDVLDEEIGKPPLLMRMERFTRVIAISVLTAALIIGLLGATLGGYSASEMFMFSVAVAVSAIPEGLPVAMTVALAIATTRMARRGLIVRRLTAVEGLGSCTLIATDKTGTLTCNELTLREILLPNGEHFQITGEGFAPHGDVLSNYSKITPNDYEPLKWLARAGILCNEADLHRHADDWVWRGDAVDLALLSFASKLGHDIQSSRVEFPQVTQIPFEPEQQYAASYNTLNNSTVVFVKGAFERVLAMCNHTIDSDFERDKQADAAIRLAEQGYRVLALADGTISEPLHPDEAPPVPNNLRFLGLVGMIDPLRPGAREAVRTCAKAGISVTMITGDHRVTAFSIARDLGLTNDLNQVMTGAELLERSPDELSLIVSRIRVFARVAPHQKLQIVEAAKKAGHFVAVTGDGVNDAPALRVANIGVAMGKSGTDVAREAAELVIADDNFATIIAGIEEGRIAYDNIRKVIYLLISTGAAELVLMALAIATGSPYLPLLPVQILWLNLVTNGIQDVALAFEPNEGGILNRQPRSPSERIFDQLMIERTVIAALVMGVIGFFTFRWFLADGTSHGEVASARNALLLLMVLFENIHIGNCRSETKSALVLSPLRSPILLAGTITAFLIHLAAIYTPLGQMLLGTEPISLKHWGILLLLALTIFPAMELHKLSWAIRQRKWNRTPAV